jgi:predicted GIY-YIG superfamily endonuclease
MAFHAYLLLCADGSFYAGHTDDLVRRMAQHESGLGGYTAQRRPVRLVWQQDFATREEALSTELRIKGWSRAKKQALVDGDWERLKVLARNRQGREVAPGASTSSARTGRGKDQSGGPSPASLPHPPFALSLSKGAHATPENHDETDAQAGFDKLSPNGVGDNGFGDQAEHTSLPRSP